jgi:hypothetical protein
MDLWVRNALVADPMNLRDLLAVTAKRSVHPWSVTRMHTCKKAPCEAFLELSVLMAMANSSALSMRIAPTR